MRYFGILLLSSIIMFFDIPSAHANDFGIPDACDSKGDFDLAEISRYYGLSVLQLLVQYDDSYEIAGTATLIDGRGYFITSAHVLATLDSAQGKVRSGDGMPFYSFDVELITDSSDWQANDFAVLKISNPQNPDWITYSQSTFAVRLRVDDNLTSFEGHFVGFRNSEKSQYYHPFKVQTLSHGNPVYREAVFPGNSGSLMIDTSGRAFGVVQNYIRTDPLIVDRAIASRKLIDILDEAYQFEAFHLSHALRKLKTIPPSSRYDVFVNLLEREMEAGQKILRLKHAAQKLTEIDAIHLHEYFRNGGYEKLRISSDSASFNSFTYELNKFSQRTCTIPLWNEVINSSSPTTKEAISVPAQREIARDAIRVAISDGFDGTESEKTSLLTASNLLRVSLASSSSNLNTNDSSSRKKHANLLSDLALSEFWLSKFDDKHLEQALNASVAARALGGTSTAFDVEARVYKELNQLNNSAVLLAKADEYLRNSEEEAIVDEQKQAITSFRRNIAARWEKLDAPVTNELKIGAVDADTVSASVQNTVNEFDPSSAMFMNAISNLQRPHT